MDFVDAGYASDRMGCFTGRGASGESSCFFRCLSCVLINSSLVGLRLGIVPAASLIGAILVLGAATTTAMVVQWLDCGMLN